MARGERTFVMKFVGDAKQAIAEMGKLDDRFKNMGTTGKVAVAGAAVAGSAVGGAALGLLAKSISVAADYDRAIAAVGATAQANKGELEELFATGLRIGRETKFSALESAEAFDILAKNGATARQIVDGAADSTVALAAATGTDLTTAADVSSRAMGIWNLRMDQMPDLVNRLTGAANASLFTIEDFNLALAQGGGAAALAGVDHKDFITLLALTSKTFASGSDAGTSFKTMFSRLNPQTKAAKKQMQELGLWTKEAGSAFYDSKGNLKDAAGIVGTLNKATKDLTEEQRIQAFQTIFGTDAIRAGAMAAQFAEADFVKLDETLGSTDAMALAKQRMDNGRDAIEQLNGAIEVIMITIGTKFLPVVKDIALALAEWLPKIPTWAFLAVGGFMLLVGALSLLGLALVPVLALGGALGLTLGGIFLAFFAIPIAIAALIASIVALFFYWDQLHEKARAVRDSILSTVGIDPTSTAGKVAGGALGEIGKGAARAAFPVYGVAGAAKGVAGLLGYASGGIVPGPRGAAQLAMVHGGETILPTHRGGGYGGVTVNVMGNTMQSDAEMQRIVLSALHTAQQRGGLGLA